MQPKVWYQGRRHSVKIKCLPLPRDFLKLKFKQMYASTSLKGENTFVNITTEVYIPDEHYNQKLKIN